MQLKNAIMLQHALSQHCGNTLESNIGVYASISSLTSLSLQLHRSTGRSVRAAHLFVAADRRGQIHDTKLAEGLHTPSSNSCR